MSHDLIRIPRDFDFIISNIEFGMDTKAVPDRHTDDRQCRYNGK